MRRAGDGPAGSSEPAPARGEARSPEPSRSPAPTRDPGELLAGGILLLTILFVAAVRVRLLEVPLERDEGEYAYAGQLILQGIAPYRLIYNMKLPGTYAAYALIMALFGQTARGIHLGFLLINAATSWLVYRLTRRLFGSFAAAGAGASYALLSLSPSVLGPFAHATHFVLLPALAGLLLLLDAIDDGRAATLLGGGFLLGLGFIMKQHGLFFIALGLLWLMPRWARLPLRRVAREASLFALGAGLPFALTCLTLAACGVFRQFWFWTFTYARVYVSEVPFAELRRMLPGTLFEIIKPVWPIWLLAAAGTVALFKEQEYQGRRYLVTTLLGVSFLSVLPGYYLRQHYFVLLLPAVALLAGVAIDALRRLLRDTGPREIAASAAALLLLAAGFLALYPQAPYLLGTTPPELSRFIYGTNPFPEAVAIGAWLKARSEPPDKIAVLGSEPEICFYSGLRSATGYIYMYGLMEKQPYAGRMQQEAIKEIEAAAPRFLVFANIPESWSWRNDSDRTILDWFRKYAGDRYDRVGVTELFPDEETVYTWGREAATLTPRSPLHIYVYERKAPPPGRSG